MLVVNTLRDLLVVIIYGYYDSQTKEVKLLTFHNIVKIVHQWTKLYKTKILFATTIIY